MDRDQKTRIRLTVTAARKRCGRIYTKFASKGAVGGKADLSSHAGELLYMRSASVRVVLREGFNFEAK